MHENWPWKWPHHPDSQSLGPLADPLADILNVKVQNVTLKGQESTSSGKEFVKDKPTSSETIFFSFLFSFWKVKMQMIALSEGVSGCLPDRVLDEGQSEFPDTINECKKGELSFSCPFFSNQKRRNYRTALWRGEWSFTRPCWGSQRSSWRSGHISRHDDRSEKKIAKLKTFTGHFLSN